MKSTISVIVPVYNGEKYVAEAIESALGQTRRPLEIVVVDDGSTDGSAEVVQRFVGENTRGLVRYVRQENGGIGAARNRGIAMAEGDVLALLDADDVWLPQKLEWQMAALARETVPAFVFGQVEEFVSPEVPQDIAKGLACEPEPRAGMLPSAMLVRREDFGRVGAFAPQWHAGEFADWVLRAYEAGLKKIILPEVVVRRRVHLTNNGIRQRARMNDYARMIKQSLDRRRAAGQEPR